MSNLNVIVAGNLASTSKILTLGDGVAHLIHVTFLKKYPALHHEYRSYQRLVRDTPLTILKSEISNMNSEMRTMIIISAWSDGQSAHSTHYLPTDRTNPTVHDVPFLDVVGIRLSSPKPVTDRWEHKDLMDFLEELKEMKNENNWLKKLMVVLVIPPPFDLFQAFRFNRACYDHEPITQMSFDHAIYNELWSNLRSQMRYHERFLGSLAQVVQECSTSGFKDIFCVNYLDLTLKLLVKKFPGVDSFSKENFVSGHINLSRMRINIPNGIAPHPDLIQVTPKIWSDVFTHWEELATPPTVITTITVPAEAVVCTSEPEGAVALIPSMDEMSRMRTQINYLLLRVESLCMQRRSEIPSPPRPVSSRCSSPETQEEFSLHHLNDDTVLCRPGDQDRMSDLEVELDTSVE